MVNCLSKLVKDHSRTGDLRELVPFSEFLAGPIFLTKAGDLGMVLRVRGCDYECLDHSQLEHVARRFNAAASIFPDTFRLYQYVLKRNGVTVPHQSYTDLVVQTAVEARIGYLSGKAESLYSLEIYFVVLYEGWRHQPSRSIPDVFSPDRKGARIENEITKASEILTTKVAAFTIHAGDFLSIGYLNRGEAFAFFWRPSGSGKATRGCARS